MAGFYIILIDVNANSDNCGYFAAVFMTHSLQIFMHCKHKLTSTRECDVFVCVYCDMTHLLWPVWIRYYKNLSLVKVVIKRKIISTSGLTKYSYTHSCMAHVLPVAPFLLLHHLLIVVLKMFCFQKIAPHTHLWDICCPLPHSSSHVDCCVTSSSKLPILLS